MEIKASWWRRNDYKLKFNALDKEVMRAVVQESLYVETPEYDYIRTYYLSQKIGRVAFSRNAKVVYLQQDELLRLADDLDAFAEREPEERMPDAIFEPPAEVGLTTRRDILGRYASMLAGEIDHFRVVNMSEIDVDEEVAKLLDEYSQDSE